MKFEYRFDIGIPLTDINQLGPSDDGRWYKLVIPYGDYKYIRRNTYTDTVVMLASSLKTSKGIWVMDAHGGLDYTFTALVRNVGNNLLIEGAPYYK